jgi:hypothetical protein
MIVRGVPFVDKGMDGDFAYMVKQPEYANTLFIINENVVDAATEEEAGAGTAVLRPLTCKYKTKPRAAGIPTGWSVISGAFEEMDYHSKKAVAISIERVFLILQENPQIDQVIFSCHLDRANQRVDTTKIGQGIFSIPSAVVNFISGRIQEIKTSKPRYTHLDLDKAEQNLLHFAYAMQKKDKKLWLLNQSITKLKRQLEGGDETGNETVVRHRLRTTY